MTVILIAVIVFVVWVLVVVATLECRLQFMSRVIFFVVVKTTFRLRTLVVINVNLLFMTALYHGQLFVFRLTALVETHHWFTAFILHYLFFSRQIDLNIFISIIVYPTSIDKVFNFIQLNILMWYFFTNRILAFISFDMTFVMELYFWNMGACRWLLIFEVAHVVRLACFLLPIYQLYLRHKII